jgi:hypothetical protein
MVNKAKGSLSRRKQGKYRRYLIYIPIFLSEDSMWPCHLEKDESVDVRIRIDGKTLKIEETTQK